MSGGPARGGGDAHRIPDGGDPLGLLARWREEAGGAGAALPEAACLATADAAGAPSARVVLVKGIGPRGVVFYTNLESRKGRELAANPRAALCFHWPALGRQARVEGAAERVPDAEADAYFATRPRGSQLGAWASPQSEPLSDGLAGLRRRAAREEERFADGAVPRPPFWSGFLVVPARIEFWRHRDDRLHERLAFVREGGGWRAERLAP